MERKERGIFVRKFFFKEGRIEQEMEEASLSDQFHGILTDE